MTTFYPRGESLITKQSFAKKKKKSKLANKTKNEL